MFQTIARGLRLIWGIALGCGLVLYLAPFWIVRRAHRLIGEQSAAPLPMPSNASPA